jgi:post-segregation antitoxin (ccd killing protein)
MTIYVYDDLAEQARAAKLPISRICREALRNALEHGVPTMEGLQGEIADLQARVEKLEL